MQKVIYKPKLTSSGLPIYEVIAHAHKWSDLRSLQNFLDHGWEPWARRDADDGITTYLKRPIMETHIVEEKVDKPEKLF